MQIRTSQTSLDSEHFVIFSPAHRFDEGCSNSTIKHTTNLVTDILLTLLFLICSFYSSKGNFCMINSLLSSYFFTQFFSSSWTLLVFFSCRIRVIGGRKDCRTAWSAFSFSQGSELVFSSNWSKLHLTIFLSFSVVEFLSQNIQSFRVNKEVFSSVSDNSVVRAYQWVNPENKEKPILIVKA